MKAPPNATKVLKKEAEKLTKRLFARKYCIVHYKNSGKITTWDIHKHHLIKKSGSVRYQYEIRNILPLCKAHHQWAEDRNGEFMEWLQKHLPEHFHWCETYRYDHPHTLREGDWQQICDDLRYYLSSPWEAAKIIYEEL